jgi:hypothetical protein
MTLVVDVGGAGRGNWKATLVEAATGKSLIGRGIWPWSQQAGPELSSGVQEFLDKSLAELQP